MSIKEKVKAAVKGKGSKAPKKTATQKLAEQMAKDAERAKQLTAEGALVVETPPEAKPEVKESKNLVTLASGEVIKVRGTEQYRAGYFAGNVGWQDMLRPCRRILNAVYHAIKIGVKDDVVASLLAEMDGQEKALNEGRVKIPSDMLTQIAAIKSGMAEVPVNHPDYVTSLRKLASLVRTIDNAETREALGKEIASAQQSLKMIK